MNIDGLLNKQVQVFYRLTNELAYTGYIRGACMTTGSDHSGIANDFNLIIELSEDMISAHGTILNNMGELVTLPLRAYRCTLALI